MMVEKIISGGQIGADFAGLQAARKLRIPTGGWMPKGFRNKYGEHPDYEYIFNMQQTLDAGYPARTRMNVIHSDGTVRFANNFKSYGELATERECVRAYKPMFNIHIRLYDLQTMGIVPFRRWIQERNIRVLNVAGNADRDIEDFVEKYLCAALGVSDESR